MTSLVEHKKSLAVARCVAFYRRNPLATIKEVAAACECSPRAAWTARQQMVVEGVCKPNRRGGKSLEAPKPSEGAKEAPVSEKQPVLRTNALVDGEQLLLLASGDTSDLTDADPETRKRMLRELRGLAFNTENHPDTRVTAMKAWFTLKDLASAADLGPGKPKTLEIAGTRLADLMKACGLQVVVNALVKAFGLMEVLTYIEAVFTQKEEPVATTTTDQQAAAPGGTSSDAQAPGHESPQAPTEVVRPIDMGGEASA